MTTAPVAAEGFDWRRFLLVAGPGLSSCSPTPTRAASSPPRRAARNGATACSLLQALLIPILYIVQELTVRLGMVTGKGHAQLIKEQFGPAWAWISIGTLVVSCIGALLTELSGLAGVGALMGVPATATLALT